MRIKERFASLTTKFVRVANDSNVGGISIIASGTTVVSVTATNVKSGDYIFLQPMQSPVATTTVTSASQFFIGVMPTSVRAGAFEITAVASRAPADNLQVAWFVLHR